MFQCKFQIIKDYICAFVGVLLEYSSVSIGKRKIALMMDREMYKLYWNTL